MSSSRRVFSSGGQSSSYHLGAASDRVSASAKPTDAQPWEGQCYNELKRGLLSKGALFEDPLFPCIDSSLFFSRAPPRKFVWKRPKELSDNPELFVAGASRFDISQGMLGDCWLLAAIAALTQYDNLLYQVVPNDQNFTNDYCGMFRFRFWQYGIWKEVVVDDRLPTYNGQLVFVHSKDRGEFWSALLEKAYAKLCGSYEALKGGQTSEAMEDFTGGVTETYDLTKSPPNLFKLMQKSMDRQSMMCCSIEAKPNEIEAKLDNGLIKGHAYSVTGVKKVNAKGRSGSIEVELVRIRNPWGNEREWKGAWGDESPEWGLLSESEKKEIGLDFSDDGEFWMSFPDFMKNYTRLEVCLLGPDSAADSDTRTWQSQIQQGSWQNHVTAGGCRNFPDSFNMNPQFRIKLEDPDDDDDVDNCTVVISVMQRDRRRKVKLGAQNLTIGFIVYKLGEDVDQYIVHDRLNKDFFLYNKSTARSNSFMNSRELVGRYSLPPGEYVIVPSTFKPKEEGDFVVRIFSEKAHSTSVMDTHTQIEYQPQKKKKIDIDPEFREKVNRFFTAVAGEDHFIDAFELKKVMESLFKKEISNDADFSLEAARSLMAMCDADRTGNLNSEEFLDAWMQVQSWRKAFSEFDKDSTGDMDACEIQGALAKLGFKLSTPIISSVALRYANKKGRVDFDDFIQICCRVKSGFNAFLAFQGQKFALDDFLMAAIYI